MQVQAQQQNQRETEPTIDALETKKSKASQQLLLRKQSLPEQVLVITREQDRQSVPRFEANQGTHGEESPKYPIHKDKHQPEEDSQLHEEEAILILEETQIEALVSEEFYSEIFPGQIPWVYRNPLLRLLRKGVAEI